MKYWVFNPCKKKGTYFAIKGKNIRVAVKEDKDTGLGMVVVFDGKETYSLLRRKSGDFEIDIDYMKMIRKVNHD